MRKPRVLYVFPQSRKQPLDAYQKGKGSNLSFQGLFLLKGRRKIDPYYSDRAFFRWNLLHWLLLPLEKMFLRAIGCGFKLDQAILLLCEFRRADIIVTTSDSVGLPLLWLKRLGLIRKPIVHVTHGLADAILRRPTRVGSWCISLLQEADCLICYAQAERDILVEQWGFDPNSMVVIPFGMDTDFYRPMKIRREDFLLAVGRDPGRDYETLFHAVAGQSWKVRLVCDPANIRGHSIPENVDVYHNISEKKVRSWYAKARCVILPLKPVRRPTGQIVLLQSLAMKTPIIVTKVPGITSAYTLRDGEHCTFVPPEDPYALLRAIQTVLRKPSGAREQAERGFQFMIQTYTQRKFAEAMEKVILSIWKKKGRA